MSDANKLSLARAIHGTPHATRDSFSPSTWAGVERAWAWVEANCYPKNPETFMNEWLWEKHIRASDVHKAIHEAVQQPKEPTVKQEPTIYGAPIIEDAHMPSGYGLVGVNMSAFEKPSPSPAPAGVPDRDALANAMQLALAKSPNDVVAPLRECRLDVVDLRYRQADAALEMFAPALRTRDERIAELERRLAERCDQVDALQHERDKVMARLGNACQPYEIEDRIRGLQMRAGSIATLTKERDEARAQKDRLYKGYQEMTARVAELERIIRDVRQATPTSDDSNWNGDPQGLANEVGNRFRELQDRVAELEQRPARRITREEVIDMAEAHAKDWREYKLPISAMTEALRAIGFEVEA